MSELIEGTFRTELDLLVGAIRHMRTVQKDLGPVAAQVFRAKMEEYFRLPIEMQNSFTYDALLRLAEQPAGTSKNRDPKDLEKIKGLYAGALFQLNGQSCLFRQHVFREHLEGYFEYSIDDERIDEMRKGWPITFRAMTYDDAWNAMTEGRMTI